MLCLKTYLAAKGPIKKNKVAGFVGEENSRAPVSVKCLLALEDNLAEEFIKNTGREKGGGNVE